MIKLYNSKTRKKEVFKPIKDKKVGLYTCGLTVYDFAHIGNLKTYLFEDLLKRTLLYNGYDVKHVMNITDVGHLVSDDDTGEDKVEKSAKEKKMDAWELTEYYTEKFKKDMASLNILKPDLLIKATETIAEQIKLIQSLEKQKYTYKTEDGIYFNTSKLSDYGEMSNMEKIEAGKRVGLKDKKNVTDFALWKFSRKDENRQMEWDSPWGVGFPGWHTECIAIAEKHLKIPFDIHCGGIDHIEIHHPNEIAQSKAAFGVNPANFWLHGEFLTVNGQKMSKSKNNFHTLDDIISMGFSPLNYRYLSLGTHYRNKMNFSKKAMQSAQNSLKRMQNALTSLDQEDGQISKKYKDRFLEAINDDLNSPKALEVAWKTLKDNSLSDADKYETLIDFDNVLGLNLGKIKEDTISHQTDSYLVKIDTSVNLSEKVKNLILERSKLKSEGKYSDADKIRKEIEKEGYAIKDIDKNYYKITKK